MFSKGFCHLFPRFVGVLSPKPVCFLCFSSACAVFLVHPNGGVPFGAMIVSALKSLAQACVRDMLSGAATHWQWSASKKPSQFSVTSKVALPERSSGRQSQTPWTPHVAKEEKLVRNF